MRRLPFSLVLLAGLAAVLGSVAAADDEPKKDKGPAYPEVGSMIPGPFHPLNVTGFRKGRYHCLVCRSGLYPTAAIFVRPGADEKIEDWLKKLDKDQPLALLIKKFDTIIDKNPDANLSAWVVFVAKEDDLFAIRTRLRKLPRELGMAKLPEAAEDEKKDDKKEDDKKDDEPLPGTKPKPIDDGHVALALDKEVPDDWKLDAKSEVTVVLYHRHKVTNFWQFEADKLTAKDVDAIVAAYDKLIPPYGRPGARPKLKLPKD